MGRRSHQRDARRRRWALAGQRTGRTVDDRPNASTTARCPPPPAEQAPLLGRNPAAAINPQRQSGATWWRNRLDRPRRRPATQPVRHDAAGRRRIHRGRAVQLQREAVRRGIGYVSEDRLTQGLIMEQSITTAPSSPSSIGCIPRSDCWITSRRPRLVKPADPRSEHQSVRQRVAGETLSGGNAQRIAIAKWVATQPKILILDCPPRRRGHRQQRGIYQIARSGAAGHGGADDLRRDRKPITTAIG